MKKYVKPSFEFVELRVEERLANCYYNNKHIENFTSDNNGHGENIPGGHPGCVYHCPHS